MDNVIRQVFIEGVQVFIIHSEKSVAVVFGYNQAMYAQRAVTNGNTRERIEKLLINRARASVLREKGI
jgi:hypothetical protein